MRDFRRKEWTVECLLVGKLLHGNRFLYNLLDWAQLFWRIDITHITQATALSRILENYCGSLENLCLRHTRTHTVAHGIVRACHAVDVRRWLPIYRWHLLWQRLWRPHLLPVNEIFTRRWVGQTTFSLGKYSVQLPSHVRGISLFFLFRHYLQLVESTTLILLPLRDKGLTWIFFHGLCYWLWLL